MAGLPVSQVVNVSVVMTPTAAPQRDFGILLMVGHTDEVISVAERYRQYSSIEEVATDFGTSAAEYLAALPFFAQAPQPAILYIGRWAKTASKGLLQGGTLTPAQQAISNFTAITSGGFSITFDGGSATVLSGINLSAATNLNGVASILDAALPSGTTCIWNATYGRFEIYSSSTGASSTVSVMTSTALSALLRGTTATGADAIAGIAAESALEGLEAIAAKTNEWYGCMYALAADDDLAEADYTEIAAYIEASNPRHIFGVNTQNTDTLDPNDDTDLASVLAALNLDRTFIQYSTSNLNAVASLFGRAFTVDFTANNSMITLKFKDEPLITAEVLTTTQANALKAKNCNVFAAYDNTTAIVQEGVMCSGEFFDNIQGTDWLANAVQTEIFNRLYTAATKVPQTDAGVNELITAASVALSAGVNNGLIAPGQWNGPNIGKLKSGSALPNGFYIYAPPIATQSQSVREQRIAPTLQIAVKLAGAIHFADAIINVNR